MTFQEKQQWALKARGPGDLFIMIITPRSDTTEFVFVGPDQAMGVVPDYLRDLADHIESDLKRGALPS